jgi:mono/diheme cytochrome c family protein
MAFFKILSCFKCLVAAASVAVVTGVGFLFSGFYPMGADDHHNDLTYWALETLRERSIARASSDIQVPTDLASAERLLAGGADYNEMCAGCHLKPGVTQSDFTLGLYPRPPDLTQTENHQEDVSVRARKHFWIIKHGIKASGMPAWGAGHDDERIWNMVAFLQRLPELSSPQYQILSVRDAGDSGHH